MIGTVHLLTVPAIGNLTFLSYAYHISYCVSYIVPSGILS